MPEGHGSCHKSHLIMSSFMPLFSMRIILGVGRENGSSGRRTPLRFIILTYYLFIPGTAHMYVTGVVLSATYLRVVWAVRHYLLVPIKGCRPRPRWGIIKRRKSLESRERISWETSEPIERRREKRPIHTATLLFQTFPAIPRALAHRGVKRNQRRP